MAQLNGREPTANSQQQIADNQAPRCSLFAAGCSLSATSYRLRDEIHRPHDRASEGVYVRSGRAGSPRDGGAALLRVRVRSVSAGPGAFGSAGDSGRPHRVGRRAGRVAGGVLARPVDAVQRSPDPYRRLCLAGGERGRAGRVQGRDPGINLPGVDRVHRTARRGSELMRRWIAMAVSLLVGSGLLLFPPAAVPPLRLVPIVTSGLQEPLYLTHAGDGSGLLFVVEQPGRIRIVERGVLLETPFLDISARVLSGGERGL